MPELGEVLGGLLADVVRARVTADELTAAAVETYRANPVLASLSVPRVVVSDLTFRVRFAVNGVDVADRAVLDVARAESEWNAVVRDGTLPRALREADESMLRDALAADPIGLDADTLQRAVDGDPRRFVSASVSAVVDRTRGLPSTSRRRLGRLTDLRAVLQREITRDAETFLARVRQRQNAERALRSRIDVEITSERLQQMPVESVQELEITLSGMDLEELVDRPTIEER